MLKRIYIIAFLILSGQIMFGQQDHLKKKLSINVTDVMLDKALENLEKSGSFFFSYDSELINTDEKVSIKAENKKLEDILQSILPKDIQYRSVGNHVVLYKKVEANTEILITGYITDGRSSEPIGNASLYDPQQNLLTASNASGYYEIKLKGSSEKVGLVISKSGYKSEVVYIEPQPDEKLNVQLVEEEKPIENLTTREIDTTNLSNREVVKLFVPQRMLELSENDPVYQNIAAQISFVPGIGTNGMMNFNSINNLSLNVLAGYSRGTNGVEVGGLVNIDQDYVNGLQLAGFGNVTGHNVRGAQISGFTNFNGDNLDGAQITGFSNINTGDINGVQIAGFVNTLSGEMNGAQIAGFTNVTTQNVGGGQIAGFVNVAAKNVDVAQISGFINYGKNVNGAQITGFANLATQDVKAVQIAGFFNYARDIQGVQISGFLNVAKVNRGVQLSFLNFSDSATGVPIGFFSYVRNGYNVLEASANENFPIQFAFKSGVPKFYNIFEGGISQDYLKWGYGLGSLYYITPKIHFNFDIIGNVLIASDENYDNPNRFVGRFEPAINFQLSKSFGIAVGPTLNAYATELDAQGNYDKFNRYQSYETIESGWYFQGWVGGKLALRFF